MLYNSHWVVRFHRGINLFQKNSRVKSRFFRALAISTAITAAALSVSHAYQIESAHRAPAFDLPLLNGSGFVSSGELFPSHEYTFLVFWDSNCPHCVESLVRCEAFYESQTRDDVAVVGIHADEGDLYEAAQLLEANGILFPQLWDVGGEAGQNYSVSIATFTLFLVDRSGAIAASRYDPKGDMKRVLEEMLSAQALKAPGADETIKTLAGDASPAPAATPAGFVFSGRQRLRFLAIDSRGSGAAGPYGEEVPPGNDLNYRFEFTMTHKLSRHLRAGGLLRISNEDERVLEAGPQYLGSEWGSAFAEMNIDGFSLRLGYYGISMTPLTLMRWDWSDNPRIGGNAGCGCGAAAGVLLVESLEELEPELVFEGGVASYRRFGVETRGFYAIPRRARRIRYSEVRSTGADPARYSLEIFGIESSWRKHDGRTGDSWEAGVRLVGSWENRRSVDYVGLGYAAPYPWTRSALVSADWRVPIVRHVGLVGEWVLWNESKERTSTCCDTIPAGKGKGGIVGVAFERPPGWNLRCDYLYLNHDFFSPFAALSYEPNRKGVRLSAQIPVLGETASFSLFYKRLREDEVSTLETDGAKKADYSYFGASFDVELSNGVGGTLGWLDNGAWRTGDVEPFDEVREALVLGARYRFDKRSILQVQYQRIDGETRDDNIKDASLANLYSVYINTHF